MNRLFEKIIHQQLQVGKIDEFLNRVTELTGVIVHNQPHQIKTDAAEHSTPLMKLGDLEKLTCATTGLDAAIRDYYVFSNPVIMKPVYLSEECANKYWTYWHFANGALGFHELLRAANGIAAMRSFDDSQMEEDTSPELPGASRDPETVHPLYKVLMRTIGNAFSRTNSIVEDLSKEQQSPSSSWEVALIMDDLRATVKRMNEVDMKEPTFLEAWLALVDWMERMGIQFFGRKYRTQTDREIARHVVRSPHQILTFYDFRIESNIMNMRPNLEEEDLATWVTEHVSVSIIRDGEFL